MKKTLSLFLALALSLALVVPASAADGIDICSFSSDDGNTLTFSAARVVRRDIKLDYEEDGILVIPNGTCVLVQPGSTITFSGVDEFIEMELYTKHGDAYWDSWESIFLAQDDPTIPDTINVDDLFTRIVDVVDEELVAMGSFQLWNMKLNNYNTIYIILDDSGSAQPQQPAGPQVSDWAKDQVARAKASGLVPDGLGDDYRVNATRAQFAAIAVQLYLAKTGYGEPYVEDMESPFTDTNDPAVLQASVLNLVNGMGDGTFAPNALVTREQAAVMLSQVHLRTGGSVGGGEPAFADKDNISSWAKYYVSFMNDNGIISGVGDNRFDPQGNASIEQALSISLRMLENLK